MSPGWRRVTSVAQIVALIAGAVMVYEFSRRYTTSLHEASIGLRWGWLALASGVWLAGYLQMIELWASSFPWWGSRIGRLRGIRIFVVANLARYVPGAIWQFASLAGMTMAAGASPAAASVGVILIQIVTLATGFAIVLSATPTYLGAWAHWLTPWEQLAMAAALVALVIVVFPHVVPRIRVWVERILKTPVPLPVPPQWPFAVYVIRCAGNWFIYGTGFWLFCHAVLGPASPGAWLAVTAYVASYIVGLLAVFAPGGIVVREGALVILLSPAIGSEPALVLAVASRLWQIVLEVLAAGVAVGADWISHRRQQVASQASASRK
jgi:hypothetical protein